MFCHECGVRNDDTALFCPECGTPVRRAAVQPLAAMPGGGHASVAASSTPAPPPASRTRRSAMPWLAGGGAVLVAAIAGAVWWGMPPAADAQSLTGALAHPVVQRTRPSADTLCIANGIRYGTQTLSVLADNTGTVAWMDTLATLGLYTQAGPVEENAGLFSGTQAVLRYAPTAELASWARNGRLCVARGVEAGPVSDVEAPRTEAAPSGESLRIVRACFHWLATGLAPWAQRPEAARVLAELPDWTLADGRLQQGTRLEFVRDGRQWISAAEYLTRQDAAARPPAGTGGSGEAQAVQTPQGSAAGPSIWSQVTGLLGRNPLLGEWEVDDPNLPQGLPREVGTLKFTRDTMETAGSVQKVDYEVREGEVVVMPQGSPGAGMRVKIEDDRLWWNLGVMTLQFRRKS